jgi:hypothetical protein
MELHGEERQRVLPGAGQKARRFRIVKLEERIAPAKGGGTNGAKCFTHDKTCATCICTWTCFTCPGGGCG